MAIYTATVAWTRGEAAFTDGKYSREHLISFDGGVSIAGSASPHVVRLPMSKEEAADPEEMLVASLSACHMLFFLDFARRAGFVIDSYVDAAEGVMEKDERGRMAVTKVTLKPEIAWSGDKRPTAGEMEELHHKSHEACFIANSFRGEVEVSAALGM
jgi:organic hydroperoxide reductase OsmC/OhrA